MNAVHVILMFIGAILFIKFISHVMNLESKMVLLNEEGEKEILSRNEYYKRLMEVRMKKERMFQEEELRNRQIRIKRLASVKSGGTY